MSTRCAALVPVKRLSAGKSRLEASLGRVAAERVTRAMLADLLEALSQVAREGALIVAAGVNAAAGSVAESAGADYRYKVY